MFLSRTQVIVALAAVGLALYVLDLVRRRRLSEDFSLCFGKGIVLRRRNNVFLSSKQTLYGHDLNFGIIFGMPKF